MSARPYTVDLKAGVEHRIDAADIKSVSVLSQSSVFEISIDNDGFFPVSDPSFFRLDDKKPAYSVKLKSVSNQTVVVVFDLLDYLQFQSLSDAINGTELSLTNATVEAIRVAVLAATKEGEAVGNILTYPVVTLLSSQTLLYSAVADRKEMVIYNNGPDTAYVGGPGVTTLKGIPIAAGGTFVVPGKTALYGIRDAAEAASLRLLESREVS